MTTKKFVVDERQEEIFKKRLSELEKKFQKGILASDYINYQLRKIMMENETDPISDWENFYKDMFDIKVNLSHIAIPKKEEDQKNFDQLIIKIPEVTLQIILDKCRQKCASWRWSKVFFYKKDIPKISTNEYYASQYYAIWIKGLGNSLHNKSKRIVGLTLEELLLYLLKFFQKTGKYFDVDTITLFDQWKDGKFYYPSRTWYPDNTVGLSWHFNITFETRSKEVIKMSVLL